uniref:Uncharacterized protein n=1 Tax=Octopus bimaculoides TaxID=37653 RepID=A0A0L8G1F3_OCTBM
MSKSMCVMRVFILLVMMCGFMSQVSCQVFSTPVFFNNILTRELASVTGFVDRHFSPIKAQKLLGRFRTIKTV